MKSGVTSSYGKRSPSAWNGNTHSGSARSKQFKAQLSEGKAIKNKRPCILSSGVIILQNNARPHVTKVCVEALARKKWEVLERPAYSTYLSPGNYHIFGPLKKSLWVNDFTPAMT
ncbi:histone-lysine N-methyltransferase SETMAR [Trichonephila clavipes]|nr:histone-lysine N-methyltransferase SETMAR [Trichonephila clavipes]